MLKDSGESNRDWRYKTSTDTAIDIGITATTSAAYLWGLSQIFNPIAIGLAAAYGLSCGSKRFLFPHLSEKYRKKQVDKYLKQGLIAPANNIRNIETITAELSRKIKLPYTPDVYLFTEDMMPHLMSPLNKWFYGIAPPSEQTKIRKNLQDNFWASGVNKCIATTHEFLKNATDDDLRSVIGHELAHLKTNDSYHASSIAENSLIPETNRALFYISMVTNPLLITLYCLNLSFKKVSNAAANETKDSKECKKVQQETLKKKRDRTQMTYGSVGAVSMSLLILSENSFQAINMALMLGILPVLTTIPLNYLSRRIETRADRNGLHCSQNLEAAINFSKKKDRAPSSKPKTLLDKYLATAFNLLSTHPPRAERIASLKTVWQKIQETTVRQVREPNPQIDYSSESRSAVGGQLGHAGPATGSDLRPSSPLPRIYR